MQNLLEDLTKLLSKEEKYTSEGRMLKNVIVEDALKLEPMLIKLLLSDKKIKKNFFQDIEGTYVFDKINFQKFISNKQFLPDSYTALKNKIGLTTADEYITEKKDVVLSWPYKDCMLEGGQDKEDAKRDEIFWNETLAPDEIDRLLSPKVLTNWKKFDKDGEYKVEDVSEPDNLLIKGNNLLGLSSILRKYRGKVKLIYLDPPYNTEKDSFRYNDSFNHSSWLIFMKNRIELSKKLLSKDGVIIIQCDDKEQAYLKVLLDEIMGRDNHESSFYIQVRFAQKTLSEDNDFQKVMEVAHIYSKDSSYFRPNKIREEYSLDKFCFSINELAKGQEIEVGGKKVTIFKDGEYEILKGEGHIDGLKETWATGSLIRQGGTAAEFLSKYLIERKKNDGLKVLYKVSNMGEDGLGHRYISGPKKATAFRGKFYSGVPISIKEQVLQGHYTKEKPIPNLLNNYWNFEGEFGNCRHEGGVDIGGGKKPEAMLSSLIDFFSNENDIVLDFFTGSGTTCAVAHKMNRRYIGIEQLDYSENDSVNRLRQVISGEKTGISTEVNWQGGGSFFYCELANANQKYIDKINKAKDSKTLLKIWEIMQEKAFISYKVDIKAINESIDEFKGLPIVDQKRFLIETLDKNMLYVPYSEIDDADYNISDEDKKLNHKFYGSKA
jgi:adenine-specific DNA-methyltransferase